MAHITYFLPGQRKTWDKDRQVSFWRGLFIGVALTLTLCAIACFGWVLPHQHGILRAEMAGCEERIEAQQDEIGILNGVLFATFKGNTGIIIEQFRKKQTGPKVTGTLR